MTRTGSPEVPDSVRLRTGETAEVALPGLGAAGYRWEAHADDDGTVEVRVARGRGRGEPDAGPPVVGASPLEVVHVTARAPGRVVVHLAQRRPWEAGMAPRTAHDLEVIVVDDRS